LNPQVASPSVFTVKTRIRLRKTLISCREKSHVAINLGSARHIAALTIWRRGSRTKIAAGRAVDAPELPMIIYWSLRRWNGVPYLSHELASEVAFMEARGRTPNPLGSITVRELQILSLLAEGKPYGQIAGSLNVSYKTIAATCGQLKSKLGVRSLPELMRIAIEYLPSASGKNFKEQ
jgi:DNA-binding CsgD family transcriptional regulator